MKEVKMTENVLKAIDKFLRIEMIVLPRILYGNKPPTKYQSYTLYDFYGAIKICHLLQDEEYKKANDIIEAIDSSILPWTIRKWMDEWLEAYIFDENLAPKGYYAVIRKKVKQGENSCRGCAFDGSSICGLDYPCCQDERPDKQFVIFKKKS